MIRRQLSTLIASLTLITATTAIAAPGAIASDYNNGLTKTQLTLNETPQASGGFYFTPIQGKRWMGSIKITQTQAGAGHVYYQGTFEDRDFQGRSCKGDITLDRTGANGVAPVVALRVKWTVQGGTNCPSKAGTVFELRLTEALPIADANGNYTAQNAGTANSETNGTYTWPRWSVISADGKLNCRATPGGRQVVFTYRGQDSLDSRYRGMNSIETASDGTTWLRIPSKNCFVRANNANIRPISIPF